MRIATVLILAILLMFPFCFVEAQASKSVNQSPSPFSISVVPTRSQVEPFGRLITMSKRSPRTFYVVLTNNSKSDQAAFENWNSWGYQAVSFELTSKDGRKFKVSKKPQIFTMNFPSIFIMSPGEQMVFPITLNDEWEAAPPVPWADETPLSITMKAVYEFIKQQNRQKKRCGLDV